MDSSPRLVDIGCDPAHPPSLTGYAGDMFLLLACSGAVDSADTSTDSDDTATTSCERAVAQIEPAPDTDCPTLDGGLWAVEGQNYWLSQPFESTGETETILFLGGGGADQNSVQMNMGSIFANDQESFLQYRVVAPWVGDGDRAGAAWAALEHAQGCFGGDLNRVHLVGHSSGGYVAFEMGGAVLAEDKRFATLTGFPALFGDESDEQLEQALECVPVLNASGAEDPWVDDVEATHERLESLGVDSSLMLFEGEGHVPSPEFDPAPIFEWMETH